MGLRGLLVGRCESRIGLSLLEAGRIFLVLLVCGMASGDNEGECVGESTFADNDRCGGGSRGGESGELGAGDVDFEVTSRNLEGDRDKPLDGDRDNECRSCLKAEVGSTWWMCVGEGKCSVPPMSPDGEYGPTILAPGSLKNDVHGISAISDGA